MKFLRLFTPAFTSIGVILIGLAAALLTPSRLFAGQLDFPPTADFKILNADGTKVIGHTHFALSSDEPGFQLIYIESHYNNGEYEVERNLIESRSAHQMPVMADYYHGFFNPGGVLTREVKANFRTGKASCTELVDGVEQVYNETLDYPATESPERESDGAGAIPRSVLRAGSQALQCASDGNRDDALGPLSGQNHGGRDQAGVRLDRRGDRAVHPQDAGVVQPG
jgi:hypothetical protein